MQPFYIVNALGACFGLCLSLWIAHTKCARRPIVCPLNGECDLVMKSSFSRFVGIPLEYLGILYYGFGMFSFLYLGLAQSSPDANLVFVVYALTVLAFLFSLYLTFVQAFHLQAWCTWCLESAASTALIFILTVVTVRFDWSMFVHAHFDAVTFVRTLGIALGVGGATISDLLFLRFLRGYKISHQESDTLHAVAQVVWVGIGLLVVSTAVIFSADPTVLYNSIEQANLFVGALVVVNALFLYLLVQPVLTQISFGGAHRHTAYELKFFRQFAFALLTVSLVSWYALLCLNVYRNAQLSFAHVVQNYALALALAIAFTQYIERRLEHGFALVE